MQQGSNAELGLKHFVLLAISNEFPVCTDAFFIASSLVNQWPLMTTNDNDHLNNAP